MDFREIVKVAYKSDYIVPGFNVFGYEDAMAIIKAAEKLETPVMLMTNRDAVNTMPIEAWASMLNVLAKNAKVPVGIHLDHNTDMDIIKRAIKNGYTSVMFDGSQLSLEDNINSTRQIADYAHRCGVAIEGEIGSVPYSDVKGGIKLELTIPDEAAEFAEKSGVDWMAISVGNIHRLVAQKVSIKFDLLDEIESRTDIPLVIHGASGIKDDDLGRMKKHKIGKINIGTAIRVAFGKALRKTVGENPDMFDRLKIMQTPVEAIENAAYEVMKFLYCDSSDFKK